MRTKVSLSTLILFCIVACAAAPTKNFKTIQYLPDDGNCFSRLMPDDTVEVKCYYDQGDEEDSDWIVVRKSYFNKELNYQDLLIKSCKKWKK